MIGWRVTLAVQRLNKNIYYKHLGKKQISKY
jgi:hypothetical protein